MNRTDTWMPLYIGDYLADTGRLTTRGHGAYMLLLMDYWRNGPLEDDDTNLAAIARVSLRVWHRELSGVIRSFFDIGEDGLLHQKRMDIERSRAIDLSDKRTRAGNMRGSNGAANGQQNGSKRQANGQQNASKRAAKPDQTTSKTGATCASYARASPSQSQTQEEETPLAPQGGQACGDDDFQTFWKIYPRQKSEEAARRAFHHQVANGVSPAVMIAGLRAQEWNCPMDKIPFAAGWIADMRWRDVPDSEVVIDGGFDPVLRAAGLTPADFADIGDEDRRLLQ